MQFKRTAAITAACALAAAATGAAIAATTHDKRESAVLADAAKRLDTTPEKLRQALAAAQDAQIDQAVEDGDLTQAQADRIKAERKASGRVLGGPGLGRHPGGPGGKPGFGGPGRGGPGGPNAGLFGDVAKALGIAEAELVEQLRDGKSVADVAKAEGRSLDDVKKAARAAVKARLDKAVADEDVTRARADAMLEHVDEHLERLDEAGGGLGRRGGRGHHGPPPGAAFGGAQPPAGVPG